MTSLSPRRAAVLVLGDLGRSPRMCYHALALADDGAQVDLVGYRGRPLPAAVAGHPGIHVHALAPPWRHQARGFWYGPAAAADLALQTGSLLALFAARLPPADVVLVQNPPWLPALPVARLASWLRRARLVVDWHNVGADMLALRLGRGKAVAAAEAAERWLGHRADAHLCVSEEMRVMLASRFGVSAHVLRDRPAWRVGPTAPADRARLGLAGDAPLVVTSSSWTDDEDFALLGEAMVALDRQGRALTVLMTGDGPRRALWEKRHAELGLRHVRPRTLWAEPDDYPRVLGCADLGVSLHRSASGVDLPMKICDMFGAGLPVCALDYGRVIRELVRPGENGLLFTGGAELAAQIGAFLDDEALRARLRAGVGASRETWAEGWRREAREVLAA